MPDEDGYFRDFVANPRWLPLSGVVEEDARPTERIAFEEGLSPAEFEKIEGHFNFTFPPDLRALLLSGLPVSDGFPNWRSGTEKELRRALDWPIESILFHVNDGEWFEGWGARPVTVEEAVAVARQHLAAAPSLIPIYSHRYIPDEPQQAGNPVFSVYGMDTIIYGTTLARYLANEFDDESDDDTPDFIDREARHVDFWSDLVQANE